jgi:hypothetical protein
LPYHTINQAQKHDFVITATLRQVTPRKIYWAVQAAELTSFGEKNRTERRMMPTTQLLFSFHSCAFTMNQLTPRNITSDPMEGVPAYIYIEVDPINLDHMDYDFFSDDDSFNEDDFVDLGEDNDYEVTCQDLEALKQMVREIRDNPDLLLQSPIYSNTVNMFIDSRAMSSPSQVVLADPSLFTNQELSRLPLARKTLVNPSFLCQECNSANVCSPSPTDQCHPLAIISEIPPLPFQK